MWYELVAKVYGKLRTITDIICTQETSTRFKEDLTTKIDFNSGITISDFYGIIS